MPRIADRFRGFLPVVMDVETGGFNPKTDAILEIAACILCMDDFGRIKIAETIAVEIEPFQGSRIEPSSLEFTGIDLDDPGRNPVNEREAVQKISLPVRQELRATECQRAILVGHNPSFDLSTGSITSATLFIHSALLILLRWEAWHSVRPCWRAQYRQPELIGTNPQRIRLNTIR